MLDFRGQVTQQVAARKVNPDSRFVVGWRPGDYDELIAGVNAGEVFGALTKNGTVDGRAKAARSVRRQGRVLLGACFHSSIFDRNSYAPVGRFLRGAG